MARHKKPARQDRGDAQQHSIPYEKEQLSPKRADEQDMPAEVRPPTPFEEAGYRKGSTEGLAERDED